MQVNLYRREERRRKEKELRRIMVSGNQFSLVLIHMAKTLHHKMYHRLSSPLVKESVSQSLDLGCLIVGGEFFR